MPTDRRLQTALDRLIGQWRLTAACLRETRPLWSAHFYDCALELEGVVTTNSDDSPRGDAERPDGAAAS